MIFSIAVREDWYVRDKLFQHCNVLACYDVGLKDVVHCRQFQGSSGDSFLSSHTNSIVMDRASADMLVKWLFARPGS